MPLKHLDPFVNLAKELNPEINPYVAILAQGMESGSLPVACGEILKSFPGHWLNKIADFYERKTPYKKLIVEIGCHTGHVLCKMAEDHPDTAFVGIDITYKRVVGAATRAQKLGLKNVFSVMANAKVIDLIFAPCEIDGTLIFFPDPWIKKKRQVKNRLVDGEFCDRLAKIMRPDGFVWFKTDQKVYADLANDHFDAGQFKTSQESCAISSGIYTSLFEQKFTEQNLPTYSSKWLKTRDIDQLDG